MSRKPPHREILEEIAGFILEADSAGCKYDYTDEDLLNGLIIANSIIGTKLYDLAVKEGVSTEIACQQAAKFGEELRLLIYTFTNIDTHELANKSLNQQ